MKHSTADNYEHFLSYMWASGARHNALLCKSYFDGADAPHEEYEAYMAEHPEQAEQQEPVIGAYEVVNEKGDEWSLVYPAAVHKYKSIPEERITQTFYAAPVRTKDLTDDEIERALDAAKVPELPDGYKSVDLEIARAVIAAYRGKNK